MFGQKNDERIHVDLNSGIARVKKQLLPCIECNICQSLQRVCFPLVLAVFFLVVLPSVPGNSEEAPLGIALRVIVNQGVSVTSIPKGQVREIFLGRKVLWDNGEQIVVATLKDNEVHQSFVLQYVGKTPSQFTRWWRRRLFTGGGLPPLTFNTEKSLAQYVADTKGAIGYVSKMPGKEDVKEVEITSW